MNKTGAQRFDPDRHFSKLPHVAENMLVEDAIKDRLQELARLVDGFANSTCNLLFADQTPAREVLEELLVKQAALGWIIRITSHIEGPIREKLWADIDRALADLEQLAGAYSRFHRRAARVFPLEGGYAASSHIRS
ncbi:MAG: hypothetical protein WB987_03110 [Candidatus Acidiferrales bacterium]